MADRTEDHNQAIALAAKAALAPLGFRRKGQSRTWLADHGYWLLVVEFQPSAWSRGSYLNVAAHWLWHPPSLSEPRYYLSFDFGGRVTPFADMARPEDFDAATKLAETAAIESERLRALLPSLDAVAEVLIAAEGRYKDRAPSWSGFNAAVAAALTGKRDMAAAMLESILEVPDKQAWSLYPAARALLPLAGDPVAMRSHSAREIAARRAAYRLPPIEDPFA